MVNDASSTLVAEWRAQSNCRGVDPAVFFPERGEPTGEAKRICASCVVRDQCLEWALANGERYGIWGGLSGRERRRMRQKRRQAARQPTAA
jgi:WhiB family redox-sensing transcriptional regulator